MAGIYVHFPFCASFCLYCGFYSRTASGKAGEYVEALLREIDARKGFFRKDVVPRTLYFGGGTPSLMPVEDLSRIACALRRTFGVDLLIVDSVQSLRENSGSDTPVSVNEAAQQLRDFGAELGIPVLLVSERPDAAFCAGECELAAVGDFGSAADVAICLRRNADTGKGSYCMSRKVERPIV